jgi:hypothetical protein
MISWQARRTDFRSLVVGSEASMMKFNKLLIAAAIGGLLTGYGSAAHTQNPVDENKPQDRADGKPKDGEKPKDENKPVKIKDKHMCKGQNVCRGKGGCKTSDNGCKGKNSCKGKGGCAVDGSKMPNS